MKGVVVNPANRICLVGMHHNKNVDSPLHACMYTPPALVLLIWASVDIPWSLGGEITLLQAAASAPLWSSMITFCWASVIFVLV